MKIARRLTDIYWTSDTYAHSTKPLTHSHTLSLSLGKRVYLCFGAGRQVILRWRPMCLIRAVRMRVLVLPRTLLTVLTTYKKEGVLMQGQTRKRKSTNNLNKSGNITT